MSYNFCCMDCGNLISSPTARYGKGRCGNCSKKGKNHPRFGSHLSLKTRKKISNALKGRFMGNQSPHWNKYRIRNCLNCGKSIKGNNAKYCTACCKLGNKNPNYLNGQSKFPYSIKFNKYLKYKIRKRDNFICQCCKINETECNRALDVHHIDYNKMNCKENNLIAVCNSCNVKANFNRDYWFAYYTYIIENKNL